MDKIQLGEIGIGSELMPGESTKKLTISEFTEDITFPITAPLQFYMVKGENTVFLKTKNSYTLYADDELQIIISDSTEVVNSATE
jgi:hypothetical protein